MKLDFVFGIHAVQLLLEAVPEKIKQLNLQHGRNDERVANLVGLARAQGIIVNVTNKATLDELSQEQSHQGVVAQLKQPLKAQSEKQLEQLLDNLTESPFLLVLDGVTDPHNLGACLRTADAAGVHAVIAAKDKSAPLNATVAKVACGAAHTLPYIQVTNLARTLRGLQERGVWLTGTAGEAELELGQANLTGATALMMGAEGKGLRRLTRELADQLINIPMAGQLSSLNVSVATGVCLFEAVRQRTAK